MVDTARIVAVCRQVHKGDGLFILLYIGFGDVWMNGEIIKQNLGPSMCPPLWAMLFAGSPLLSPTHYAVTFSNADLQSHNPS